MHATKSSGALILAALAVILSASTGRVAARVEISRYRMALPGYPSTMTVSVDNLDSDISGFNLLLAVDLSTYSLRAIRPGGVIGDCGWEYFTYRIIYDTIGQYDLYDFTNLVQVTGLAGVTEGFTPACYGSDSSFDLVEFDAVLGLTKPSHRIECRSFPIQFYWRDCSDNVLYSRDGDTVYFADRLHPYESAPDTVSYPFPGFGVPDPDCANPPGQSAVGSLTLVNGSIEAICPDWPSIRGDINLNDVHYEMADLVLFIDYFLYGLSAFTINISAQLAQTDINCDGLPAAIGDLLLMRRVIVGDIEPIFCSQYQKRTTYIGTAALNRDGSSFSLEAATEIGAVYVRYISSDEPSVPPIPSVDLSESVHIGAIGDTTTLLFLTRDGAALLPAGRHELFEIPDPPVRVIEAWASDMSGQTVRLDLRHEPLPVSFDLQQNYPNPFNPATTISFTLPEKSGWRLTILNVRGQIVREYEGSGRGTIEIRWDGRDAGGEEAASGVYFYRLEATDLTAARKMLLLK